MASVVEIFKMWYFINFDINTITLFYSNQPQCFHPENILMFSEKVSCNVLMEKEPFYLSKHVLFVNMFSSVYQFISWGSPVQSMDFLFLFFFFQKDSLEGLKVRRANRY